MKTLAFAFAALFLLPYVGMAAQKAITISSLNAAYQAQIADIDAQIASTTAAIPKLQGYLDSTKNFMHNVQKVTIVEQRIKEEQVNAHNTINNNQASIDALKKDRHNLEITYNLLVSALQ